MIECSKNAAGENGPSVAACHESTVGTPSQDLPSQTVCCCCGTIEPHLANGWHVSGLDECMNAPTSGPASSLRGVCTGSHSSLEQSMLCCNWVEPQPQTSSQSGRWSRVSSGTANNDVHPGAVPVVGEAVTFGGAAQHAAVLFFAVHTVAGGPSIEKCAKERSADAWRALAKAPHGL